MAAKLYKSLYDAKVAAGAARRESGREYEVVGVRKERRLVGYRLRRKTARRADGRFRKS